MKSKIKSISKVEVKHLWNDPHLNFEWNLNSDVNILAGDNGTGKSTILVLISSLLKGTFDDNLNEIVKSIKITFDTGQHIVFENIEDTIENLEFRAKKDKKIKEFIQQLKRDKGKEFNKIESLGFNRISFESLHIQPNQISEIIGIDYIKTFDIRLKDKNMAEHILEQPIRTDLDIQITQLQTKYLNYQVNLGKRAFLAKLPTNHNIDEKINIFKQSINKLFKSTKKQLNPKDNYISFIQNKIVLKPFQLSSGEKQILIVLLSALLQDDKPFISLMDEPEISLHTDWQEQLIETILKLNKNAQIIIATHSPFVISHGWGNKVSQIENLIKSK